MKCLWNDCNLEAWSDGDDRSHFCLDHAWRAAKRGEAPSHFLPSDAQRARLAAFPDALSNRIYFPLEYITLREGRRPRLNTNSMWPCRGPGCEKIIISGVKYCGECRTKLGMSEDEEYTVQCSNAGEPGPGRYLNDECRGPFPVHMAKRPPGSSRVFCPQCFIKLDHMGPEWRKREGYDF